MTFNCPRTFGVDITQPQATDGEEDMEDCLFPSQVGNNEEFGRLKLLLEMEQAKNHKMEKESEELKGEVVELKRRDYEATQTHQQERRENDVEVNLKDARIHELQTNCRTLQHIKNQNIRVKDEIGALLQVIQKRSRSPLPQTS